MEGDEVITPVIETDHVIMVIIVIMITTVNVVTTVITDVTEITDLNPHPRHQDGMPIKVETTIEKPFCNSKEVTPCLVCIVYISYWGQNLKKRQFCF